MSGRRILDAALLFSATRVVTRKHFQIRSEQLQLWGKTSAIAKALKGGASKVAPRRNSGIATQVPGLYTINAQSQCEQDIPRQESVKARETLSPEEKGLQQDHHYERSLSNSTGDPVHEDSLEVQQEEAARYPTPDGSIPPAIAPVETGAPREIDSDVFVERPAAPRANPVEAEESSEAAHIEPETSKDSTIPEPLLKASGQIPEHDIIPEQEGAPEGINTDVFHSPRVAQMLSGKSKDSKAGVGLTVKGTGLHADNSKLAQGKDLDTFNDRQKDSAAQVLDHPVKVDDEKTKMSSSKSDISESWDLAQDIAAGVSQMQRSEDYVVTDSDNKYQMRESRVPSSRLGRLWQYGGLATGMAFGAVGETFRRVTGGESTGSSLILSAANMERLVAKLSRMRGAALKLGQMMSFQDSKMLPAPIAEVLRRVQDNADYMPASQRNRVLKDNLGPDWRSLFSSFDEVPVAAASIGQVHRAVLASTDVPVAVKIQYPGVASSISSDLNNLSVLLTASRLLPKGLFLDKTIANARTELGWECDYEREASCQIRFRQLLEDEQSTFLVPKVFPEACGPQVLTAEFMSGLAVTKTALNLNQEQRDWIGTNILRLCLRELMEFKFMQTDPNWTNFLFNAKTNKLELLDFGAAREYPDKFVDPYVSLLLAAAADDRQRVRDLSVQLGYLTGHESRTMEDAHIASVMTLAEPFLKGASIEEPYDFRDQTITDRVRSFIPVMVRERLAPPPEETYSLHRKLSGAFLLLARLGSRVKCRQLFVDAVQGWEKRRQLNQKHLT